MAKYRNGDSCNHNCFIRSYSLPLSSFHVWNKAEAGKRIWQYSSRKAGGRLEKFQTIRSTRPVVFSKRRGRGWYRYNGTKGNGIPQKRANKNLHFTETMKYTQVHSLHRFLEDGALLPPRVVLFHRSIICSYFIRLCVYNPVSIGISFLKYTNRKKLQLFPMSTMDSIEIG